jgi:hypothetical protein
LARFVGEITEHRVRVRARVNSGQSG